MQDLLIQYREVSSTDLTLLLSMGVDCFGSDPIGVLIRTFLENQNSAINEQDEPTCTMCLRAKSICICEDLLPF